VVPNVTVVGNVVVSSEPHASAVALTTIAAMRMADATSARGGDG
jgi:hypothetical protein